MTFPLGLVVQLLTCSYQARAVLTDAETVINAVDEKKKEEANEVCFL